MPTDSSVPVVRSLELRDINNALNAIRERLRGIATVADTANLKAGQLALTAGQGNGALILLQQQVTALQSAVAVLSAGASGPTAVYRADRAVQANDPVYTTSDGGVSSVDTQDPTAIFAVIGIAVSGAAAGSPVTVRRSGVMTGAGVGFEEGRAVYAQVGSGLTQHPNYAAVAIPVGVAVSTTAVDVRGGWPALTEPPMYAGGYEDFMPVALILVRQVLDFVGTIFGQPDGIVVKIGEQLVTRSILSPSGSGVDVADGDGVFGDPSITLTGP